METASNPLFRSNALERLTKSNRKITTITYSLIVLSLLYLHGQMAGDESSILLFFVGVLTWTFAEYGIHRWLFHWTSERPAIQRFKHLFHGVHHDHPWDEDRLYMPPLPGLLISLLFLGMFYLLFKENAFLFHAGFMFGYLGYTFVHQKTHEKKKYSWLSHLYKHHNLHHHKCPDRAFGVTTRFWDKLLGTMPD